MVTNLHCLSSQFLYPSPCVTMPSCKPFSSAYGGTFRNPTHCRFLPRFLRITVNRPFFPCLLDHLSFSLFAKISSFPFAPVCPPPRQNVTAPSASQGPALAFFAPHGSCVLRPFLPLFIAHAFCRTPLPPPKGPWVTLIGPGTASFKFSPSLIPPIAMGLRNNLWFP